MLTIIHGENQVACRKKLAELLATAKQHQQTIINLEAEKLDRAKLETVLLSDSLFGEAKVLVLEYVHSLPKSKKKDEFINLISSASIDIILLEKKLVTKTDLKKLPRDTIVHEFKITPKLWTLLDHLSPVLQSKSATLKLLRESIASDSGEFVLVMLARQIRLLIQVKENQTLKMAPFMLAKLSKQARNFSLEQLLKSHQQLYLIDQKQKQSAGLLSLEAELDLFVLNM